jgi:SNF2 family DNA or RNA helicase
MEERESTSGQPECPAAPAGGPIPTIDFTSRPEVVRVIVEGERLSYGHLCNPSFATEVARIDPLPHQRIAVYDHMLHHPRLRFLLADDAGAGKTIMAGLYIREMLNRRLLRRVLIIPPAGLVGNWAREMHQLFNLPFRIVAGGDVRSGNPFAIAESDLLIVSVDTLAGGRMFACLQAPAVVPYDLVVFDEAHKLSISRGADYRVKKTDRYRLAEVLAGVHDSDEGWKLPWQSRHLLLLTATPHMGKDYPYYGLWRLLDPLVLSTPDAFDAMPSENRQVHFIRRTKEEMVRFDGGPLYPMRTSDTLTYELTQGDVGEQRLYDEATDYMRTVYNRAKLLNRTAAQLAMSVFQRRLASSTYALMRSMERRIVRLDTLIADVEDGRITIEQLLLTQRRLAEDADALDAKTADEEDSVDGREENEVSEENLLQGVIATSLAELKAEREKVRELHALASQVYAGGGESKFTRLAEIVADPTYASEKLLIFSEHRDTLDFLVRRLEGMGFTGQVAHIHGGMDYKERERQVDVFRTPTAQGGARFLVATDAAGEGINLQFCWIMVNYDIPWNPARLEQRMGRIHRYGQKHNPVVILNLVAADTREGKVLKVLLDKLERIRQELRSDKVFDVVGRVFLGVSLREYMERAVTEPDASTVLTALAGELTTEQVQALQERERRLYGDGGDVRKELGRLRDSLEQETYLHLLPGYVRQYIESAAPLVGLRVDGDLNDTFGLRPIRPGALDPVLAVMDTRDATEARPFSVSRPAAGSRVTWLHPGQPVFEGLRDMVSAQLGMAALRGAVFVDPQAATPYLLHVALVSALRRPDPEIPGLAAEETLEISLVALKQADSAAIDICPVEQFLLLRGGRGLPAGAQRLAVAAKDYAEVARAHLLDSVARGMADTHRERLTSGLAEREAFIHKGFDYQEADLAAARAKQSGKAREGNRRALSELNRIRDAQRQLAERRQQALAALRREPELIGPGRVEFVAHALVVPSTDPEDLLRQDAEVEAIAVRVATAFEEADGATVKDVHTPALARAAGLSEYPGFDLLSQRPGDEKRPIEVKGRSRGGEIEVSANEWGRAATLRERYWLYVVYDCATAAPRLLRVQDPFGALLARETGSMRIPQADVLRAGAQ